MAKLSIYLDYAAATPVDRQVLACMEPFYIENFYNPSATYDLARKVHAALDQARAQLAIPLGARPSEIIFTAGGTEANNLAIHGIMSQFPDANLVVSSIEHESVLAPARRYDCREVAVGKDGRLKLDDLRQKIDDKTVLVSIMHANNEIGTIQPVREAAALIKTIRRERLKSNNNLPLYLHSDACQAGNYLDLHNARLGVDMMTINGGKLYGPKQSGALFVKAGVQLRPLIDGGGQERGLRSGTENVAGAIGLAVALNIAQEQRHSEAKRLKDLQGEFLDLLEAKLPEAVINGSRNHRLPNNVHVSFPGGDNERLLIQLDELGIMAAAGSACSASSETPSHVLKAIGLSDKDARSSIRLTMGRETTEKSVQQTVQALIRLLA